MRRDVVTANTAGGWAFIVGGLLLASSLGVLALLPDPPALPTHWVHANSAQLFLSNELMSFGLVLLTPAVLVLGLRMRRSGGISSLLGPSCLALALVVTMMLVVIQGRLVDPVFGIELDTGALGLVVGLLYGGLHMLMLMLAFGMIVIAFGMRRAGAAWLLPLSLVSGVLQLVGAFPWLTPEWVNVAAAIALAAWTVGVGVWLLRREVQPAAPSQPA